jgi:NADH dehydrogenase [ubiquinone] 1 alpha subcomplex assembly factor 6
MAQCNVQEEQVLRQGPLAPNIKDAVFTIATRANDHLITAREMLQNLQQGKDIGHDYEYSNEAEHIDTTSDKTGITKQMEEVNRGFPVLMTAIGVSSWLERLERNDFDIFSPEVRKMYWKLPWSLYLGNLRRRF